MVIQASYVPIQIRDIKFHLSRKVAHYKEVKWSRSPEKSVLLKRTHEVLQQQMLRILL